MRRNPNSLSEHFTDKSQRSKVTRKTRGKPAYLEPNRNAMQKPIGGLSVFSFAETIEDRSRIGCSANQNHDENRNTQPHAPNYIKRGYSLFQALETTLVLSVKDMLLLEM